MEAEIKIRLIRDIWHLKHVGQLDDGKGYWITGHLNPEAETTRDFIGTYIFNKDGSLSSHNIVDLGLRSDPTSLDPGIVIQNEKLRIDASPRKSRWDWILGNFKSKTSIAVYPFQVQAFDQIFGLVVREPEDDSEIGDDESTDDYQNEPVVDVVPGYTLMFHAPWEEGIYAT